MQTDLRKRQNCKHINQKITWHVTFRNHPRILDQNASPNNRRRRCYERSPKLKDNMQDIEYISEKPQNTRHNLQASIQSQTIVITVDNGYIKEQRIDGYCCNTWDDEYPVPFLKKWALWVENLLLLWPGFTEWRFGRRIIIVAEILKKFYGAFEQIY